MCGILGYVSAHARDFGFQTRFEAALKTIAHRGPDGEGVLTLGNVVLGHRRLSIIDLTDDGSQPMHDSETGVTLVFNGEIYNYIELRSELMALGHRFRTKSDTEVLLRSYIQWGLECFSHLNGMFAIGCYDPRSNKLVLARDRFGVKPLYYAQRERQLAFSSEPAALIELDRDWGVRDEASIGQFLLAGRYATGSDTFYRDIKSLCPGHYLLYDTGTHQISKGRYWNYPRVHGSDNRSRDDVFEEFEGLFESAVKIRLRADVRLGVSLSGGLDSTAILTAATRLNGQPPVSFTSTYGSQGSGEYDWAAIAAGNMDSELFACPSPENLWLQTLDQCIDHLGGPVATPAVVPLWHLTRAVKDSGITVLLDGQGADELLGGYVQYAVAGAASRIANPSVIAENTARIASMFHTFSAKSIGYTVLKEYFPATIRLLRAINGYDSMFASHIRRDHRDDIYFSQQFADGRKGLDHRLWLDHSDVQLARLLHYGDSISMANSLESRMPFMDFRLVEWAFSLPEHLRVDSRHTKWMIREYLRRHGQQQIADRRDKQGYPTPFTSWLASNTTRSLFADLPSSAVVFDYVDRRGLQRALGKHEAGAEAHANLLFRILTLHLWLEKCSPRGTDLAPYVMRQHANIRVNDTATETSLSLQEPSGGSAAASLAEQDLPPLAQDRTEHVSKSMGIAGRMFTLAKNNHQLFWHSVSYASNRGFPFVAAFALAKILDSPQFGEYIAATTFFATLMLFADLGFALATTTRVARNSHRPDLAATTMAVSVLICVVASLGIALLALFGASPIDSIVFAGADMRGYVHAAVLFVPAAAIASVIGGALVGLQQFRTMAVVGLISGILYVSFAVGGGLMSGALAAAWGAAAAMLVRAIISFWYAWGRGLKAAIGTPFPELRSEGRALLAIALPASIAALAWMPTNSFLLAVLMHQPQGKIEVAGFGVALQVFSIVSVFSSLLTQFALPRLSVEIGLGAAGDPKLKTLRYCVGSTLCTAALAATVALLAPHILTAFGPGYARFKPALITLMICAVISGPQGILSNYLLAVGHNWIRVATWFGWAFVVCVAMALAPSKTAGNAALAFTIGWAILVVSQGVAVALHKPRN